MNKKFSKFLICIGFIEILSSIVIHPYIAKYWRSNNIINYYDSMFYYSIFAFSVGLISSILGLVLNNTQKSIIINFSLLFVIVSSFFLADRILLAKYGKELWQYDEELHFEHRPNSTFSWGNEYENKIIKINYSGYHDDEFVIEKGVNEKRIFVLGNSIVMGHGVNKEETFSNQLERLLSKFNINVLNFGVQGYSTIQEQVVLKRNLKFLPDIIIDGFCLNDITEPIYVDKDLGGTGYDYHRVYQISNSIVSYFINETGFGRLVSRIKFADEVRNAKSKELEAIDSLIINPFYSSSVITSWKRNLNGFRRMKEIADSINNYFMVLIFPYTNQFLNETLQKPQQYLIKKLTENLIEYIDFTKVFEKVIKKDLNKNIGKEKSIKKYFLDEDHFTTLGHKIVAAELKRVFEEKQLVKYNIE